MQLAATTCPHDFFLNPHIAPLCFSFSLLLTPSLDQRWNVAFREALQARTLRRGQQQIANSAGGLWRSSPSKSSNPASSSPPLEAVGSADTFDQKRVVAAARPLLSIVPPSSPPPAATAGSALLARAPLASPTNGMSSATAPAPVPASPAFSLGSPSASYASNPSLSANFTLASPSGAGALVAHPRAPIGDDGSSSSTGFTASSEAASAAAVAHIVRATPSLLLDSVYQQLTCQLCQEPFNLDSRRPKVLACGHSLDPVCMEVAMVRQIEHNENERALEIQARGGSEARAIMAAKKIENIYNHFSFFSTCATNFCGSSISHAFLLCL